MYTASDLRKGLKIQIDGEPYIVTEFDFSKPGKGQALYRTKMRNMITGVQFTQTYRSNDKFDRPNLEERTMQFLYAQDGEYHFMDTSSYEQIFLMQNSMNRSVSEVFDTYIYTRGIVNGQYSLATAAGLFKSVVSMIMVIGSNKVAKIFGESGLY